MYGNAQNLAALEEKTGPVLAMYRSLKSLLRPYVEDNESIKKEVSSDDWITVLEQMLQRLKKRSRPCRTISPIMIQQYILSVRKN